MNLPGRGPTGYNDVVNENRSNDDALQSPNDEGGFCFVSDLRLSHRRTWEAPSTTPLTSRPHFRSSQDLLLFSSSSNDDDNSRRSRSNNRRRMRSRSLDHSNSRNDDDDDHEEEDEDVIVGVGDWKDLWFTLRKSRHCLATPPQQHLSARFAVVEKEIRSSTSDKTLLKTTTTTTTTVSKTTTATTTPFWICCLYGAINAAIVLPVLMTFASIIYRHQAFQSYMPILVQLTIFSGMVHQLCFSTFSNLPFAVGQVQDAGLIFLSSMATYIVHYCEKQNLGQDVLLATTTVVLSLGTAFLGLGLVLIGQGGLAQYVQLLPTSVVGGYLAFIGWFCGMAGIGLMAGESTVTWNLVCRSWIHILPGILGGLTIYFAVRWLRHTAVLPICILALLAIFYGTLTCVGWTIQDATEHGWIRNSTAEAAQWARTWDYIQFDKVEWSVIPNLIVTELSMIFVVAMSSSLDVAAIELEVKRPFNYNGELKMVGVSNLISGLTGGYTGSYIFSQTIFSLRAGINSRAAGYALAAFQAAFFLLPFPIFSYIPNFFFGSLLTMICVDLLFEWLWHVRHKVTPVEYCICWSTFGLIQLCGVEFGILLGVMLYVMGRQAGLHMGNKNNTAEMTRAESIQDEERLGEVDRIGVGKIIDSNGKSHTQGELVPFLMSKQENQVCQDTAQLSRYGAVGIS